MMKSDDATYVRSDAGALAGVLVCRPSTAVDRLVPLKSEPYPIAERALEQHAILVRTLRDRRADVRVLPAERETPTEALVGDCAVVLGRGAVVTRPSAVERRHEAAVVERALVELGVPILGRIEAPGLLDGADAVVAGDRLFIGVPAAGGSLAPRSNALGRAQLAGFAEAAGLRVVELAVAPGIARLRNVFNLVGAETAVASPESVDLVPVRDLRLIEVPRGEEYAAGVFAFGERRVVANLRFRESVRLLRAAKVEVEAIDLWEFGKAGVAPPQLALAYRRG